MFLTKNQTGKMLAALPIICAAMTSMALAADEGHALGNAAGNPAPLFLTATNGAKNYLAVINTQTKQTTYIATGGVGGAGGNAGGVAVDGSMAAMVNFGSSNVTIFVRQGNNMEATQVIKTASKPVSVAFGQHHLVVLELTYAESFRVNGNNVASTPDGTELLVLHDGSAAQVVTFDGGAMYSEKTGSVAGLPLSANGLSGPNTPVMLPPAPNNNTPFGMIGRGANVYLTIAHSDLEALVVKGKIVSLAEGPMPFKDAMGNIIHAPCWNALFGQFLFSSDSPGKQLLRYLVSDTNVFLDKPGVARLTGAPTDLTVAHKLLGVIDGGNGSTSNASVFNIDSEGELTLSFAVQIAGPINGAAIIR